MFFALGIEVASFFAIKSKKDTTESPTFILNLFQDKGNALLLI